MDGESAQAGESWHGRNEIVKARIHGVVCSLEDTMMTVMRDAMTKDIVHGNYSPQNQPVDFCSALQHAIRSNRFEFSWGPDPFPVILTDVCVMLYIAKNAASNACKYGGPGPIKMEVSLLDNELRLMCKNPPGEGHEELMKLENPAVVFEKESRLHGSILPEVPGAGHGGWIVQLCAQALKGTCTIEFTPSETIFELRCPAKVMCRALEKGYAIKAWWMCLTQS